MSPSYQFDPPLQNFIHQDALGYNMSWLLYLLEAKNLPDSTNYYFLMTGTRKLVSHVKMELYEKLQSICLLKVEMHME